MKETQKLKIKESKLGDKNPMWKGDGVGYYALHGWIRKRLYKPDACPSCGQSKTLDLANISNEYKRDLNDWEWLCRRCHMKKDGRLSAWIKNRQNKTRTWSKLTEADIIIIRQRVKSGESCKKVSESYPVNPQTISKIINGHSWVDV